MKTYEPLPLLECIKEYNNPSNSPSPQKSIEMSDEDVDQDQSNLLNEFKSNSPNKTYLSDIQVKTIESEYNRAENGIVSHDAEETMKNSVAGQNSIEKQNDSMSSSVNPCAKTNRTNIVIKTSLPIVSSTADSNELTEKTNANACNKIEPSIIFNPEKSSFTKVESNCRAQEFQCDKSELLNETTLTSNNESVSSNLEKHVDKTKCVQKNDFPRNEFDRRFTDPCIGSLSNIETLSPYVRTNEFINEILKSPAHQNPPSNLYEECEVLECNGEFKEVNLNSPLKCTPEQTDVYDSHLVHLRTLEEIDEDEALGLCSTSVSSTLSSTTKRLPCISDSGDIDSGTESASSSWDRTVAEAKGHAITRLQEELRKAHEELKLKDEEVARLSRIREEVESELEELTASLFQEAHNMVREANMRQATSEKLLRESKLQVDVLSAEVNALKTLVLTSTPSRPNPHLHPQIENKNSKEESQCGSSVTGGLFRKHRRSPSHCNLKYGREDSPPSDAPEEADASWTFNNDAINTKDCKEVDPVVHKEFLEWRKNPSLSKDNAFIARIYEEDIDKSLDFSNTLLTQEVRQAVDSGDIFIEAVSDKTKCSFPKKCSLLEVPRLCQYRMKLGTNDQYYYISKLCRNRIIKVCDFLNYLHYIQRGLVKSSAHDVYWEINRLRKEIMLARLGLTKDEE